MPGTFDRMKIHFSLCAQHLQEFKNASSTEEDGSRQPDGCEPAKRRLVKCAHLASWLNANYPARKDPPSPKDPTLLNQHPLQRIERWNHQRE